MKEFTLFKVILCLFFIEGFAMEMRHYFLPDAMHEVVNTLTDHTAKTQQTLTVVTPELSHSKLAKAIEKAAKRDVNITLITSGAVDEASRLVQYRNVDYRILEGLHTDSYHGSLGATLLLFDDRYACVATLPLTALELSHSIGLIFCSDDTTTLSRLHSELITLRNRSKSYLK